MTLFLRSVYDLIFDHFPLFGQTLRHIEHCNRLVSHFSNTVLILLECICKRTSVTAARVSSTSSSVKVSSDSRVLYRTVMGQHWHCCQLAENLAKHLKLGCKNKFCRGILVASGPQFWPNVAEKGTGTFFNYFKFFSDSLDRKSAFCDVNLVLIFKYFLPKPL